MFVPTRRVVIALAVSSPLWLLPAALFGRPVALGALVVLAIAVIVDVVLFPDVRRVELSRELPPVVGLGDKEGAYYSIHSEWSRPVVVRVYDALPAAVDRVTELPDRLTVPPHETIRVAFRLAGSERGVHAAGPMALRVIGRLGLLERTVVVSSRQAITVAPSLHQLRQFRLRALHIRTREFGARVLRRRGDSLSFARLRPYMAGDDPRHIDWKATARRGNPIVREYDIEQGQVVIIAIDAGRVMTPVDDGLPRFEHALTSASVLASVAADAGDRVGLLLFDDEHRTFLPPQPGVAGVRAVRSALTGATARLVEPDYAAAFATISARQRRRALIVVFTDVIDPRSSRALVASTSYGARRHLTLVVAFRSGALTATAIPSGHAPQAEDLYRSAAAEELMLARDEALQRMRQSGVSVLDVQAGAMSAAVVNRYLEIKGRGAL